MSSAVPPGSYQFGPFRLDPASRMLDREGTVVPLAPRTFDLLHSFVRSGGRLLTKHELLDQIWGDVNVQEASLAFQVSTLRKALGEDGTAWIETVPKHGYRFTARVRDVPREDTRNPEAPSMPPVARVRIVPAMWRWAAGLVVVVAALVAFRYASRPDDPIARENRLESVPFTSYTGREAAPTFSPDGAQVAFTWDGESQDNPDIYVKAIAAEQPLRLTSDRARDGSPAWSPDGTRIAFLRDKPGGGSEVRLIPPTGGPERTIGEVLGLTEQGLSWSPDGRSLAVVDRSAPGEHPEIFVLEVASGAKKRLAPAASSFDILPAFSPDGRTLAFNRTFTPGGPFVHVVGVAGGEPRMLRPRADSQRA
jgi:DNA-binding winged helix-turn-helix (wHTH) protein